MASAARRVPRRWRAAGGVRAVNTIADAARNDYNLSPSRYVASDDQEPPLPLEEALVLLAQAEVPSEAGAGSSWLRPRPTRMN